MSIECKAPASGGHKAEGAHGKSVKSKAPGPDAQDPGAAGGFMAILSAMDTQQVVDAEVEITAADTSAEQAVLLADAAIAQTLATDPSAVPTTAPDDVAAMPSATQAPTLPDAATKAAVEPILPSTPVALPGVPPVAASATSQTAAGLARARDAGGLQNLPAVGDASGAADKRGLALGLGKLRAHNAAASQQQAADAAATGSGAGAAGGAASAEFQDQRMQTALEIQKLLQPLKDLQPIALPTLARDEKRMQERSVFSTVSGDTANATAVGANVSPDYFIGGAGEAQPVGASPEVQVAEQVQFWISQDVQNAQLQLEGLGELPVEVSITMHGNEAHVAFRTDELIARDVLEGAQAHLKDMLGREGLVLGGVSVGTSGSQGADSDARQQRQGRKPPQVASVQVPSPQTTVRNSYGVAGRAVDLFV